MDQHCSLHLEHSKMENRLNSWRSNLGILIKGSDSPMEPHLQAQPGGPPHLPSVCSETQLGTWRWALALRSSFPWEGG